MEGWVQSTQIIADAVKVLAGGFVGFIASLGAAWVQQRRRARTAVNLIYLELRDCRQHAIGYLKDDVKAPLGRMPIAAYAAHFASLALDANLSDDALVNVRRSFSLVETFNRGLDAAAQAAAQHDDRLNKEDRRNRGKAEKFTRDRSNTENYVNAALTALEAARH